MEGRILLSCSDSETADEVFRISTLVRKPLYGLRWSKGLIMPKHAWDDILSTLSESNLEVIEEFMGQGKLTVEPFTGENKRYLPTPEEALEAIRQILARDRNALS